MPRPIRHRLLIVGVCAAFLGALTAFAPPTGVHIAATNVATAPWLTRFNAWRANTGTSTLTENTTWSAGDAAHALYMVKNDLVTHYETPGVPYYTADGDTAAQNSNIYVSSSTSTVDDQAIDWWMGAPFHSMGMMDPRLTSTGFGSYREVKSGWDMGAAVDVLRGNSFSGGHFPVYFPGNGTSEPLTTYSGNEFPDPLQACPGYSMPTGLPVFIEVGGNIATTAGPVHTFTGNGTPLEHCVIDSNSPSVGSNLTYRGGVVVIPRQPLQNGVKYTVALTVNGTPYTWSFSVGLLSGANSVYCTYVGASAAPSSPSATGASVTVTASSNGCPHPQYRFWVSPPGQGWTIAQDFSATNTFLWTTTGLGGDYRLEVDARDASESIPYDVVYNFTYSLSACSGAGLTATPASPRSAGSVVLLTGTATCPGTPTYRFWTGQNGIWHVVQDYSTLNTFSWNTAGVAPGTYGLEVDVRNQGATAAYEKVANGTYTLSVPTGPCNIPSLSGSPSGSASSGSSPVFTASTTGCTPNYRFWVGQNGMWTIKQDYSASSTFSWNTTGNRAGTYGIEVDVRDASSSVAYDHVANITYTLNGCSSAQLRTDKASPQVPGTTMVLTGSATCPGTPTYRFLVGGTVVQDYSTTSTYSWNSTGKAHGTYSLEVDVRDQGAGGYEVWSIVNFTLSACTGAGLGASPPGHATSGTTVTLTATATCPGTPTYRFLVNGTMVQDYSTTSTFSWNTTGKAAGTYQLEVDVRDQGAGSYEVWSIITYTLS